MPPVAPLSIEPASPPTPAEASAAPGAARREALAGLRASLAQTHRAASSEAFVLADDAVVRSGLPELDGVLGGGFPRGVIATLEGPPASGRSTVAARLLARATAGGGLGALIEVPHEADGALYPPALAAAGVDLDRLLIVHAPDTTGAARAADIVLRSEAFGVVVVPALNMRAQAWTRLASLTHRSGAVLIALGDAGDELRYFASVRVRLRSARLQWNGGSGLFATLAGAELDAAVLKHKRAAPGRIARIRCRTFEHVGVPLESLRERDVAAHERFRATARVRASAAVV